MDILFISYKYPPSIGGMQKQSYHLVNGFSDDNVYKIIYDQSGSLIYFFISLFWRVPVLLKANPNINIIHFNDGVCALCCVWMRLFRNKILTVTYHGLDLVFPNLIYQKMLLPLIRSYDAIITVSSYTKQQCIDRGFPEDKVHVVLNGVDHISDNLDSKKLSSDAIDNTNQLKEKGKKIIVAIGRPVKRKGYVWFVKEVLSKLSNEYVFILIGPEPKPNKLLDYFMSIIPKRVRTHIELFLGLTTEHKVLNDLLQKKGYKHKFFWYKNIDHTSKEYILSQSNMMVMPNVKVEGDMEGFGLVALEANMFHLPVIAADLEGITSAVSHNKNGLLIESEHTENWIKAISTDVHNRKWSCREYAMEQYGWDKMAQEYRGLFAKVIYDNKKEQLKLSNVYT